MYKDRFDYLVSRGYDVGCVNRYFYVDDESVNMVVLKIYDYIVHRYCVVDNPRCLIVGGQPGCGKSCFCNNYIINNDNYVYVSLDNYRVMHPFYREIRDVILDKWGSDNGDDECNPSNDLTYFTHYFAVMVNDRLLSMLVLDGYNIILEWNLRDSLAVISFVENTYNRRYVNDVLVVVASRYVSYRSCLFRYDVMKDMDRLSRRVSLDFHNLCVSGLIDSVSEISKCDMVNSLVCVLRDGEVIDYLDISLYLNSDDFSFDGSFSYAKWMYDVENDISYLG